MIKTSKIVLVMIIIAMITLFVTSTTINATYSPDKFKGKIDTMANGSEKVRSVGGKIVGLIRVVGTIVSVGIIIVLGIKYMMGSAEERAEYKKTLFPYFIGAVLIYGGSNIAQVIYEWASKI